MIRMHSVDRPYSPSQTPTKPRLLDHVREVLRRRHYSLRTEQSYVDWIKRFILFHCKRHPAQMGKAEVTVFLTHLAVRRDVAASTQNQALSAILFLYRHVLEQELEWVEGFERPKRPARLPVVLTRAEARAVLGQLDSAVSAERKAGQSTGDGPRCRTLRAKRCYAPARPAGSCR